MKAFVMPILSAGLAFIFGVTVASFKFLGSNNSAQKSSEPNPTVAAPVIPTATDDSKSSFHSSNLSRIVSMLNQLVESKGAAKTSTFYVEEVNDEELGGEFTRAYWKEDKSLIILTPPYDAETSSLEWTYSRRIDLVHDVVPTEADVGTSNYLVTRPWIKDVLRKCQRNGVTLIITKNSATAQSNNGMQRTRN